MTTDTTTYDVGDIVTVQRCPGYDIHNGQTARITEVNRDLNPEYPYKANFGTNGDLWFSAVAPVEPDINATLAEAAELRATVQRMSERYDTLNTNYRNMDSGFLRTMQIISDRLNSEAVNRGWCSEFDNIIEEVNGELPGPHFLSPRRKRERKTVRITGTVWTEVEVWVDEDEDAEDPDNWYATENDDDALGSDWAYDRLDREMQGNGWDDVEYSG